MQSYLDLLDTVLTHGIQREDRTKTGTYSLFGEQIRIDLRKGFPLLTTKKLHLHSIIHELLWFLKGHTDISYLKEHKVRIWNEWADENGQLGPIYGKQWRQWPREDATPIDQIALLIENIKQDPYSRRHIISAWNVAQLQDMALMPCHCFFQFYVSQGHLSCHLYQRSADIFLGVPFNIASYALLTHFIAQCTNLSCAELIISFGDLHLYTNHLEQARMQLTRIPRHLPDLYLDPTIMDIDAFRAEHIRMDNYAPHPVIKAPIAV